MNGGFAMTEHHCHDAYGARTALPAHLSLLRDALTGRTAPDGRTCATSHAARRHVPIRRDKPAREALATPLTLEQWVSRTAYIR